MRVLVLCALALLAVSAVADVDVEVITEPGKIVSVPSSDKSDVVSVVGDDLIKKLSDEGFSVAKISTGEIGLKSTNFDNSERNFCVPGGVHNKCKVYKNGHVYFTKWGKLKDTSLVVRDYETDITTEFGTKNGHPLKSFEDRLESEAIIGADCEGTRCDGDLKPKSGKPVAIVVLGPSASGKSFATKTYLNDILKANNVPKGLKFHTVDGGKMREESQQWKLGYQACTKKPMMSGCKDLYDLPAYKAGFKFLKSFMFKKWTDARENIMLVETLASFRDSAATKFYKDTYLPLTKRYRVILMVVYGSRQTCAFSGSTRAVKEGKAYPSNNYFSWNGGLSAASTLFNLALEHEKKVDGFRSAFAILRNNHADKDMSKTDKKYDDCNADIMSHLECRIAGKASLRIYTPEELVNKKFAWVHGSGDARMSLTRTTDPKPSKKDKEIEEEGEDAPLKLDQEDEDEDNPEKSDESESVSLKDQLRKAGRHTMVDLDDMSQHSSQHASLSQGTKLRTAGHHKMPLGSDSGSTSDDEESEERSLLRKNARRTLKL